MHSTKSTHGLCIGCLNNGRFQLLHPKKSNFCIMCQKQPAILFNQDPYCTNCYVQSISSPLKSENSSQRGHNITKKFYKLIDKQQIKSMRKSFLSSTGKLIKKINKLFQQNQTQNDLIALLSKKATSMSSFDWEKMLPKVTKSTNIVYIFIGEEKIIGAFHSQAVNIDGQASVWDQQAGIFFSNKHPNVDLQFARIKSDLVGYSSKSKSIKFGSPSSLQITFEKLPKLKSQIQQDFQWTQCFIYRL